MNRVRRFVIDKNMRFVLAFLHLNEARILERAGLPVDFFDRRAQSLSTEQYFDLWTAIVEHSDTEEPIPLMLEKLPLFAGVSAPIMAALCSRDFSTFAYRIQKYKPLIGPLAILIEEDEDAFSIEIATPDSFREIHPLIVASEMIFFVRIFRYSTGRNIVPLKLETIKPMGDEAYERYLCMRPEIGDCNRITFSIKDAHLSFEMADDSVWARLESGFMKRLHESGEGAAFSARVSSALMELLPVGECSIGSVAERLCVSSRTLQRRLRCENTTYQQQLNRSRNILAKHYLSTTDMSISEIAFLLGFEEHSSFSRAFHRWTELSPDSYRNMGNIQ